MHALRRRWFLLLLVATLVVGIGGAEHLESFASSLPRNTIIGSVLLAMALPLQLSTMWLVLRRPLPALIAVVVNFLIVPLLAWCASRFLQEDLALGMIVAAAVPSTLASAAVWTRLAGGNDSVSLLVTMITNLSCFLVTPGLIQLCAGRSSHSLGFTETATKLLLLIVVPILAAQLLRAVPAISTWATAKKVGLSTYAQLGILAIVFVGSVNCGLKIQQLESQFAGIAGQIVLMLVLVAVVHLIAWWCGYWIAGAAKLGRPEQLAVAFSGSQKTLMVGLAVALSYGGLTILPMLAYHVEQLLIDTVLADRYSRSGT